MPIRRLDKTLTATTATIAGEDIAASSIPVKPHIQPGVLYPSYVASGTSNKLLDGTTNHSGAFGTVQSDGRSYYYTNINGSKPIKDPRIGAYFGSQRHKMKSLQLLEQETATHGTKVYSLDGREWLRGVGTISVVNDAQGMYIHLPNTSCYFEVVGYFSDVNYMVFSESNRYVEWTLDGGTESTGNYGSVSPVTPLNGRYVDAGAVVGLGVGATLGIHTIKIRRDSSGNTNVFCIELIAQDTGTNVRRNHVNIPAQNVVSYGKKFSIGSNTLTNSVHKHYNPFAFKTDGSTAWASGAHNGTSWPVGTGSSHNIDTATSLGLENWKHGTDYYKPYNGGRVVKWVASDGTIKTSVNVMPPNAQNNLGSSISAKANAAVANNTFLPTFSGTVDNTQAEVAKTYNYREFGNGSANGNANFADGSKLHTSTDDIAYVMDDGLTNLSFKSASAPTSPDRKGKAVRADGNDHPSYIFFIGTGVSGIRFADNSTTEEYITYAQNLSYGTHILSLIRRNGGYDFFIDGVEIENLDGTGGAAKIVWSDFTFHQPKMPPIPDDACIIADYMLMADYVKQTDVEPSQISKGVRYVSGSRDHQPESGGTFIAVAINTNSQYGITGGTTPGSTHTGIWKLPFFGTTGQSCVEAAQSGQVVKLGGATATKTLLASEAGGDNENNQITISGNTNGDVALGITSIESTLLTGSNRFYGHHVVTPIHTSSHYQEFETPYLKELVGGDRNMEQTNLVVTSDGKTWDEVTRDTSYIGKVVIKTDHNNVHNNQVNIMDEWRGEGTHGGPHFNKDFAIAYDRMICLKAGQYVCSFLQQHSTNDDGAVVYVNGTVQKMTKTTDSGLHSNTLVVSLQLDRGDYVQAWGCSGDGSSQHNLHVNFQIEKQ